MDTDPDLPQVPQGILFSEQPGLSQPPLLGARTGLPGHYALRHRFSRLEMTQRVHWNVSSRKSTAIQLERQKIPATQGPLDGPLTQDVALTTAERKGDSGG